MRNPGKNGVLVLVILLMLGCNQRQKEHLATKEDQAKGETLFNSSMCISCHSISGEPGYGPTLKSILNTKIQVIRNNETIWVTVDRDYIRRSIKNPDYEKPIDFKSRKMPLPTLSDDDIERITDYLIFLNSNEQTD